MTQLNAFDNDFSLLISLSFRGIVYNLKRQNHSGNCGVHSSSVLSACSVNIFTLLPS